MCLAKSPNKHNRLFCKAVQMEEGLPDVIEKGDMGPKDDPKLRSKTLQEDFGYNIYNVYL